MDDNFTFRYRTIPDSYQPISVEKLPDPIPVSECTCGGNGFLVLFGYPVKCLMCDGTGKRKTC